MKADHLCYVKRR